MAFSANHTVGLPLVELGESSMTLKVQLKVITENQVREAIC